MNLTSKTTFSELQMAETTKWSQKQSSSLSFDECEDSSHAVEWAYLAQGRATVLSEAPILNTHGNTPNCFCDHYGLSADFSNLESLNLESLRLEMDAIAHELGDSYRRLVLGTANKLLWHWADCVGAIGRGEHGVLEVNKAIARKMATANTLLKCALTDLRDYLAEWWDLNVARTTLTRWVKEALDGLGIVQWFGNVANGKKPRHWAINVPALLLLAEACERRIIGDAKMAGASAGDEMAVLPEHQGYSLKLLFDAVFPGFGWNREGGPEEPEPQTYAETDEYQAMKPHPVPRVKDGAFAAGLPELAQKGLDGIEHLARLGLPELAIDEALLLAGRWPGWAREIGHKAAAVITRICKGEVLA